MSSRLPLFGAALPSLLLGAGLAGCVGGALASTVSRTSPAAPPDAFTCIQEQLKKAGFRRSSYDTDALRVTGQKFNESARRSDVQFRRLVDRVEFEVSPDSGGVTRLTAEAATFAERMTHRGPTEEQEKTSEIARAAADTVLERCSTPVDSTQVPG
ncbi:MAG: hypothetical protein H0T68_13680 [Gemmatimonadales bacterium]|nr:hypothetical protein [Gemmatimonadales bacterium]MBA3553751.1 hypothetical protein [Gemmatimonadales bacterium]